MYIYLSGIFELMFTDLNITDSLFTPFNMNMLFVLSSHDGSIWLDILCATALMEIKWMRVLFYNIVIDDIMCVCSISFFTCSAKTL